ncbi:MAG: type II secretion system F family protein [Kiritimatiellae bacterium]|nr:type II secretion system F family protein [Kiritimatiellia bacterium]
MGKVVDLRQHDAVTAPPPEKTPLAILHKPIATGANRIRERELPAFARQLATMLTAGISLADGLSTLEDQTENASFKTVIANLRLSISRGSTLTAALSLYPAIFDEMFVQMLRSGEVSGRLAETLERLAAYLEFSQELRRKVRSAMMYPMVVAAIAVILFFGMMVWIVPAFENIYKDLGGVLPGPTRMLVTISKYLRAYAPVVAVSVLLLGSVLARLKKTESGGYVWDRISLHFPIFGVIKQKTALTRLAESLAQMLSNGIPILTALELSERVTGNRVLGRAVLDARVHIAAGETLSSSLKKEKCFPAMVVKMISVGERTGKIDDMLMRVADFYGKEVSAMLAGLASLVEPLLIVVVGTLVGGMVVGMFLPIFKMHEIVSF